MLAALPVVSWFALEWPEEASADYPGGVILRDAAGEILRVSLGRGDVDCRPSYVADPDDWIVKAIVAAEDGSFWTHRGVRPLSTLRALVQNVIYRRRISGASTITMQAVRLIRPHPKTYLWKWREAVMALKMERARSKVWILSQYLNRAPYGSNFVGIEAAARGWFGKGVKELGLGEAALLAGMVQAPSRFRPDRGYDRAVRRRDYVLGRLVEMGLATPEQAAAARVVRPALNRSPRPFRSPHYCDWFLRSRGIDAAAQQSHADIVTPLDVGLQAICERAVATAAAGASYSVAALVRRVGTDEVVALACSGDYFNSEGGQVNTAVARRPAGSTLKPFLVAHALDRGSLTPDEPLDDSPVTYSGYRPANFDGQFRGPVSVRDALVQSLNIPFVRLLERVGVPSFEANLRRLGFTGLSETDVVHGLGLAVGNVEVSLDELSAAYRTLAAEGGGVYTPESCRLVADMLSGAERTRAALGHVADVALPRFAWKTGTSSAFRDAWTVLWNPEYVIAVWCGHLTGGFGDESLVGAKAAAPVAWSIARQLYPQNVGPWFAAPKERLRTRRAAAPRPRPRENLAIASPEEGAVFAVPSDRLREKIVCRVRNNPAERRLWWFLDGSPLGETTGEAPFLLVPTRGEHTISCTTESGDAASVRISVTDL